MLIILFYHVLLNYFASIAEFVVPIGIKIKEAKAEMKIDPVTIAAKMRKCSI